MSAGIYGQLGFKDETAWGTAVTVDEFHAGYVSGNPVRDQPPIVSKGIRAGRLTPTVAQAGARTVAGGVSFELYSAPLSTLLSHMFGTVNDAGGSITATPASVNGQSFTTQVGIPDTGGTVRPFTYSGCKLPSWTLSGAAGEPAMLEAELSAKDYVTSTNLASASYGTQVPFTFYDVGTLTADGTAIADVTNFELAATRPLRTEHYLGGSLIAEQIDNGFLSHIITVETEFSSLSMHDLANSEVAVIFKLDDGTHSLQVTANAFVHPTTPEVQGADELTSFTFTAECVGTSDANAVTAVLINDDVTS